MIRFIKQEKHFFIKIFRHEHSVELASELQDFLLDLSQVLISLVVNGNALCLLIKLSGSLGEEVEMRAVLVEATHQGKHSLQHLLLAPRAAKEEHTVHLQTYFESQGILKEIGEKTT